MMFVYYVSFGIHIVTCPNRFSSKKNMCVYFLISAIFVSFNIIIMLYKISCPIS